MPAISFLPFLHTVPWGTRALTLLIVAASLLQFGLASFVRNHESGSPPQYGHELPWLVFLPGISWKYPWTLLTAGFVELHILEVRPFIHPLPAATLTFSLKVLVTLSTVPLACRYLERLWGAQELLKFSAVVIVGSNIIAFGFAWLVYLVTGSEAAM